MFKSLFNGSDLKQADLSFLAVDMHSHLLPGLDDGLQAIEQTIEFIQQLQQMGYQKLICTPHILQEIHPNSPEIILSKLDLVRNELSKASINIQLDAAAEYMIDLEFEKLIHSGKPLMSFGDKNYILVEMSYMAPSPNFEKVIFDLQMKGYKPIFAHPERYSYFLPQKNVYKRLVELGCDLQVNILSLSGFYGKEVKRAADMLFKKNLVSFLGTDLHHERHLSMLKELVVKKEFLSTIQSATLLNKSLLS